MASSRGSAPQVTFFSTPAQWCKWLEKNHASAADLWVGFYKRASSKPSMTWPESVDEALCFGCNKPAWRFFAAQAPWYRRTASWWVISAKREETREKRFAQLTEDSAAERRIGPLRTRES